MLTQLTTIEIGSNEKIDLGAGAWENKVVYHKFRAHKQAIYEKSYNKAMEDGQRITARFMIRNVNPDVERNAVMVRYQEREYKQFNLIPQVGTFNSVVELREVK